MVLLESGQLGHNVFITSYCTVLKALIKDEKIANKIEKLFHYIVDLSIEFCKGNGKFPCAGNSSFLVNHMIRIIECYMLEFKPKFADEEEIQIPADIEDRLNNALIFSAIWGIGGCLDETTRKNYDAFLQDMLNGEDVREKHSLDMGPDGAEMYPFTKIPNKLGSEYKSLFDLQFDQNELKWVNWNSTVDRYVVDKDSTYLQLSIPTIDSIRMVAICEMLLKTSKHVLFVGPTGTGKSI